MPGKKFYVVWVGKKPGLYTEWSDCKEQVYGFKGAKYKSFTTKREAEKAMSMTYEEYTAASKPKRRYVKKDEPELLSVPDSKPIVPSICVDAACNMETRVMEYRCVDTDTGAEIFHEGPFNGATNNIGEYLALVHALAMFKKSGVRGGIIYSDSVTAMAWVRDKQHNSKVEPDESNSKVMAMLSRADNWLSRHDYDTSVLKWETKRWGEIPADFGRK